jgi:hypothetical protein
VLGCLSRRCFGCCDALVRFGIPPALGDGLRTRLKLALSFERSAGRFLNGDITGELLPLCNARPLTVSGRLPSL